MGCSRRPLTWGMRTKADRPARYSQIRGSYQTVSWEKKYEELKGFRAEHGHCEVPTGYKGGKLRRWVSTQRRKKKTGKCADALINPIP